MISFSPTQKKAFYSESSPMNRHCLKNDHKLNYNYTYPFRNDLVFFRDYNCFPILENSCSSCFTRITSRASCFGCHFSPSLKSTNGCRERFKSWSTIYLTWYSCMFSGWSVIMIINNYYCQCSPIEIDLRRFSLICFVDVTPLYLACIYCVTLRSYALVYGKASS